MLYVTGNDTFISSWYPAQSFGTEQQVSVRQGDIEAALVSFHQPDLSTDAEGELRPPVVRARLQMFVTDRSNDSSLVIRGYRLLAAWNAGQATWQRANNSYAWAEQGCNSLDVDRERMPCSEVILREANRWISLDVTGVVQYWQSHPDENHGLILKGSTVGPSVGYLLAAFNHPNPAARPRLLIEFASEPVYLDFSIELRTGLNMVSLPLLPKKESDIATALEPFGGALERVWAYESGDPADPWRMYEPGHPANDLLSLDVEVGYWFEMSQPAILTVVGEALPLAAIPLRSGWNFVGYPLLGSEEMAQALQGIADKVELIWYYDAGDEQDPWKRYSPAMPPWTNDLVRFSPGQGYWILVTEDCVLQLP